MEPLVPIITVENLRRAKKNAQKSLKELRIDLSSSTTGNLVANIFGYRDWNTASAIVKNNKVLGKYSNESAASDVKQITTTSSEVVKPRENRYILDDAPSNDGFVKTLMSTLNRSTFAEKYVWKATDISFLPSESTAVIGAARCGKTHLMMSWANALEKDQKMKYLYFLTEWHRSGVEVGSLREASVEDIINGDCESGIIFIGRNETYEEYSELICKAIKEGWHIFMDENPFLFKMLDDVLKAKYSHYTIAIQGIFDVIMNYKGQTPGFEFNQILIGKSVDAASIKAYEGVGIIFGDEELMRLGQGQFFKAVLAG